MGEIRRAIEEDRWIEVAQKMNGRRRLAAEKEAAT